MKISFSILALCIISLGFLCLPLNAKTATGLQAPGYKERSFNKEEMKKTRANSDFKYAQPSKLSELKEGIIDRIRHWFYEKYYDLMDSTREEPVKVLLVTLAIGLLVFYLVKGKFTGAIGIGASRSRAGEFIEENIHAIDFDKALAEAIAAKEFRLATRLYFLMTLKTLSDRKLINVSREKTNRQYLYELKNEDMRSEFRWLMRSFEFIWYGNTQPGQTLFQQVQLRYKDFLNRVEQSKRK